MGREAPSEPVLEVQEGELSCSHIPGWWAAVGKGGGVPPGPLRIALLSSTGSIWGTRSFWSGTAGRASASWPTSRLTLFLCCSLPGSRWRWWHMPHQKNESVQELSGLFKISFCAFQEIWTQMFLFSLFIFKPDGSIYFMQFYTEHTIKWWAG